MFRNPYIKLAVIISSLFIAIGIAYTQMDMFKLTGYRSSGININAPDKIKSEAGNDEGINEPESPDYFSIFKFISNFAPVKKDN